MRKNGLFPVTFLLLLLCAIGIHANSAEASAAFSTVNGNACIILDHIVYERIEKDDPSKSYYSVCSFFDTEESFQTVTEIRIPSKIDGVPVKKVDTHYRSGSGYELEYRPRYPLVWSNADQSNQSEPAENGTLKKIVLPNSIKKIGVAAFRNLAALEKIQLPKKLVELGNDAFSNCVGLKEIVLPQTLKTLGGGAFANTGLTELTLPHGLSTVPDNLCADCKDLTRVTLPDTVKTIGLYAFFHTGLSSVQLPKGLKGIYGYAFKNSALKTVKIPAYCDLYAGAFRDCKQLKKVTVEKRSKVLCLRSEVFYGCENLKTIQFPAAAAAEIAPTALRRCKNLQSLTIPSKTVAIRGNTFADCSNLKKLRVLSTSADFLSTDAQFLQTLPDACRIYVKTEKMKQAFLAAGCNNRVIVKADLK